MCSRVGVENMCKRLPALHTLRIGVSQAGQAEVLRGAVDMWVVTGWSGYCLATSSAWCIALACRTVPSSAQLPDCSLRCRCADPVTLVQHLNLGVLSLS